jgi:hypothetical protein
MTDQDNAGGFEDFEDFMKHFKITRQAGGMPDDLALMGYLYAAKRAVFLQVDSDDRLVLLPASPRYDARLPVLIPAVTPGKLESAPTDGHNRLVVGIDIINYETSDTTCTLYLSEEAPGDTQRFIIIGKTIGAFTAYSWRGKIELDATLSIWGLAGDANRLRAFFSVRFDNSYVRD